MPDVYPQAESRSRPAAQLQPNRAAPQRLRTTILVEQIEAHRVLDCRLYEDCLDRAALENWASWSCAGCPLSGLSSAPPPIAVEPEAAAGAESPSPGKPTRRARVIDLLRSSNEPLRAREIADSLGVDDPAAIRCDLSRLEERGELTRVDAGRYAIANRAAPNAGPATPPAARPESAGEPFPVVSSAPAPAAPAKPSAPPDLASALLEAIGVMPGWVTAPQLAAVVREKDARRVADALTRLADQGRIARAGRGFFRRAEP